MTCDERVIVAYLAGDLDADARASFERHLLSCEECWAAVREDRTGRQLAEQLRSLAPSGLRDRVQAIVELERAPGAVRHVAFPRRVVAIAAAAIVVAGSATFVGLQRGRDPAVVADVLRLAAQTVPTRGATTVHVYAGRRVEMSMYEMDGEPVVVARSDVPFPMPSGAMPLGRSHGEPWMAHRHDMTLLSLGHPSHVLIGGRMPPERLLAFARGMGLSP